MSTTVAIIGAGPLGRWLAWRAGRAGFRVLLEDVMPNHLHHAREELCRQLGPETLSNVLFVSTIEDAAREADLVIDCVPDELESKLEIFWLLDRMAPPRTVLATPTTRLSIADLASCTYRPEKCAAIVLEAKNLPGNPEDPEDKENKAQKSEILMRSTAATAPETIALLQNFWRQLGFTPSFEVL